jgi:hypothetical protein
MKVIMRFFCVLLVCLLWLSCKQAPQSQEVDGMLSFGEKITADEAISYNDLYRQMGSKDSLKTKVKAKVLKVCQTKGCWMTLSSDELGEDYSTFVKFKDYGFFMPKDCAGQEVIMEGTAFREVTTVEELRHYAEDEGVSQEEIDAITEPVEELKFLAHGVLLLQE